jgi:hypothetical protein
MSNDLNYYEDLIIDPNNLNEAVEKQPTLYMQYAELAAEKRNEVQEQKKVLKVKDAELKEVSAKLYLKYKMEKVEGKAPTENQVQSAIEISKEFRIKYKEGFKELEKLNKLNYQLDILESAVTSFQQRKNMIEEAIKLFQLGYNSQVKQDYNSKTHERLNKKD